MKRKFADSLTCILFCGFLAGMLVLYLVLPKQDFSEKEKRYLAESPKLSWESLSTGDFSEDVESYLADHIPGRDFLVGFNAYLELYTGKQVTKDVYLAEGDRLVEAPGQWNGKTIEKNMTAINAFAESLSRNVDMILVPSAGYCLQQSIKGISNPYLDDKMIQGVYDMAGGQVSPLNITDAFFGKSDFFYRTDHHWTSRGAYEAYSAYMTQKGRQYLPETAFAVTSYDGFLGSTYSRSGLWLTEGEKIELWDSGAVFTVSNQDSEATHDSVFYPQRLEELDKYTVYLDGNHSLVRVENPAAAGKGKLLVIRDSYANCLGGFLANSYETVILVDLRYYKEPVSQIVASEGITDVLVCYSLNNFLTDSNIVWLR